MLVVNIWAKIKILKKYGDKLGPTVDYLREVKCKTRNDIINSYITQGKEFNDLAGIK